jgi:hypothetical protein
MAKTMVTLPSVGGYVSAVDQNRIRLDWHHVAGSGPDFFDIQIYIIFANSYF